LIFCLVRGIRALEQPARDLVTMLANRLAISETGRASLNTFRALGMRQRAMQAWVAANDRITLVLADSRERMRRDTVIAQGVRYAGLAAMLLFGGLLAIEDHASAAVVLAAAMMGWLGFSPLVRAIETVEQFVAARQGWARLDQALASVAPDAHTLELPIPKSTLTAEGAALVVPGARRPTVQGISFDLKAGEVMTVIGPGGSGKSAILRAVAGAWPLAAGKIRLDGAALDQWNDELLGRHIGYLPQTIDLIEGTVAENIARFDPDPNPEKVVDAAHAAGVHDMIVRLPDGYNSQVGPGGNRLSMSQAQRVALARAFYGDPFIIILDEPTSHLDGRAEKALSTAIGTARDRGAIVILGGVAASIIEMASHVLVLREGGMVDFGEKEAVRQRLADRYSPNRNNEDARNKSIDSDARTDNAA
ncbi:MAG: ATP-binding cassette domain-containing protein, partial [Sphingobium sp.]